MSTEANRLPPMGWPWDAMADAILRWDDANRRHHAAGVIVGTVDTPRHKLEPHERAAALRAMQQAALDREDAIRDRQAIREEVARQWLLGLRLAIENEPTALRELLGQLPPAETMVEAIQELEDRVDGVAAGVKKTGGESWELANWIARLEREMNSQTGGAAHGDRSQSQGQGNDDQRAASGGIERQAG